LNSRKKLVVAERRQIRAAGGGRKKVEEADPELPILPGKILEETSAGDPMSALRWTNKSAEAIADELTRRGHPVSDKTEAWCLRKTGYSMQLNQKTREGPQHRNRDRQFRYINHQPAGSLIPEEWRFGADRVHENQERPSGESRSRSQRIRNGHQSGENPNGSTPHPPAQDSSRLEL
jgi:hypothetical protein